MQVNLSRAVSCQPSALAPKQLAADSGELMASAGGTTGRHGGRTTGSPHPVSVFPPAAYTRRMRELVTLSFHGAAGVVSGSKHLLTAGKTRILLDAGIFQGLKELRKRNWADPPFDPKSIDHVLVTHGHIDHVGDLPRLAKLGLRCPVHCTPATHELLELLLLDAANVEEEDARWTNWKGYSDHKPALPLFSVRDARKALGLRHKQPYNRWLKLDPRGRVRARFRRAGHLLGSAFVELRVAAREREICIVYVGDLGHFDLPLHLDPQPLPPCDVLVIESTYGDRLHSRVPLLDQLRRPLKATLARGGTVLIPVFAVGRAQQITLMLRRLVQSGALPDVPIHVDSPMAVNATRIYSRYLNPRNLDARVFEDGRLELLPDGVELHQTVDDSKRLNFLQGPRIILASSEILSGGRVLHHLKHLAPDENNLLLLVGYQGAGTRGRKILDGARTVRLHGREVPVRARVVQIDGLSGHADYAELLQWVGSAPHPPRVTFVVHGEPQPAEAFAARLRRRLGTRTIIPALDEEFDLLALLDTDEATHLSKTPTAPARRRATTRSP